MLLISIYSVDTPKSTILHAYSAVALGIIAY